MAANTQEMLSKTVFADEAPKYWKRDFCVVPIAPGTKLPPIKGWPGLVSAIPNAETQRKWLGQYATHGIGLLTSQEIYPGEYIIAIDVDDNLLLRLVRALVPGLTIGKVGRKGATYFVRVADKIKSAQYSGAGDLGIIDILATSRMTVLPPTKHPDTNEPYYWIDGKSLLDATREDLPLIEGSRLKLLKVAVESEHTPVLITGQSTHDAGVAMCAQLVVAGASDNDIETIFVALLPENYSGNSLEELPEWIKSAREKFPSTDGEKRQNTTGELVEKVKTVAIELFHDRNKDTYITVPTDTGIATYRLNSSSFHAWLRHAEYRDNGKAVNGHTLREVTATLHAVALYEGEERKVFNRIGGDNTTVELYLGGKTGKVARMTAKSWTVESLPQFRFVEGTGSLPLPIPERGGKLSDMQILLSLSDEIWLLLVIFMINALRPSGPYLWLSVEGEHSSGKSMCTETIKLLLDPNALSRMSLPSNIRDLVIQAKEFYLLSYDNASGMTHEMSDALCMVATGGGLGTRELYTNDGLHVMNVIRPFMINGIGGFASESDLLIRSLPIFLPEMPEGTRATEEELLAAFVEMRPRLLGSLCDAVVMALASFDSTKSPSDIRMADAAKWVMAAAPAFGSHAEEVRQAIVRAQKQITIDSIVDDPLTIALLRATERKSQWEGHIGKLWDEITEASAKRNPFKNPSSLSKRLKRLKPSLKKIGISVEYLEKDRGGQKIRITIRNPEEMPKYDKLEY